jgi:uncharacterized membrane protein
VSQAFNKFRTFLAENISRRNNCIQTVLAVFLLTFLYAMLF